MDKYRRNYFRAGALIVDGGTKAKRKLLQHHLDRNNMNLLTFIEVNQHEIYHLYSEKCCQCLGKHPTTKVLKAKQMEIIFAKNCKRCKSGKGQSSDPFCCSTSKIGVRIEDFDITLLHSILVNVCIQLFWDCALRCQGKTFQQFLVENQHSIYHLWKFNTGNCCLKSCNKPSIKGRLTEFQWLTLYHTDTRSSSCKTGQKCFCSYCVNTSLIETQLEKSIAMTLQNNFCRLRLAVENLLNHRNTWAHHTECQMSDNDFCVLCTDVTNDILFISGYISKECETLANEEIDLLKTRPLESSPLSHLIYAFIHCHESRSTISAIDRELSDIQHAYNALQENQLDEEKFLKLFKQLEMLFIRWFDPDSARETVYDQCGSIETKDITDSPELETDSDSDSDQYGAMTWNGLYLAAIDIGGSYSGTSFLAKDNPQDIRSIPCYNSDVFSKNTKTSILMDNKHDLIEFGSSANDRYCEYVENEETDFFYINGLKKDVYRHWDTRIQVYDVQGKSITACRVFSTTIRKLSQNCIDFLNRYSNPPLTYSDMQWVLTVPPYCTEGGRRFIRECASKAGITQDRVSVFADSDAAAKYYHSILCSRFTKLKEESKEMGSTNIHYLLIDIGGSTTNITVYRHGKNRSKQVGKSYNIELGGNSIDDKYLSLLKDIFTEEVIIKTKLTMPDQYSDIFSQFERSKRQNVDFDKLEKIRVRLPFGLIDTYTNLKNKNISDAVNETSYKESVRIQRDRLSVSTELYKQLYENLCEEIKKEIQIALVDNKFTLIYAFILIGGVSNSSIVERYIGQAFPGMQIIRSHDETEVIRTGALQLALTPTSLTTLISNCTIGIRTQPLFDETKHADIKRVCVEGVDRCMDVFDIFVRRYDKVSRGGKLVSREVKTIREKQKYVDIIVVTSLSGNPQYVDDPDCKLLGKLHVSVGDLPLGSTIKVSIKLDGPEVQLLTEHKDKNEILKSKFVSKLF